MAVQLQANQKECAQGWLFTSLGVKGVMGSNEKCLQMREQMQAYIDSMRKKKTPLG